MGMDITSCFGDTIGESVVRPELMSPRTLDDVRGYVKSTRLQADEWRKSPFFGQVEDYV